MAVGGLGVEVLGGDVLDFGDVVFEGAEEGVELFAAALYVADLGGGSVGGVLVRWARSGRTYWGWWWRVGAEELGEDGAYFWVEGEGHDEVAWEGVGRVIRVISGINNGIPNNLLKSKR